MSQKRVFISKKKNKKEKEVIISIRIQGQKQST